MVITTSVILCTRNRLDDIMQCLKSLRIQSQPPDELIIVDSSDTPLITQEPFNMLFSKERFTQTALLYLHTKPGLTFQRNQGIQKATKELIYFFDDDVIMESDYLEQMNSVFTKHPGYSAGMGNITNLKKPTYKYQLLRTIFMLPRERSSGKFTWSGLPTHPYGTTTFKEVEVLGGCCMAFRRDVFNEFLFDEYFQGYSYLEDACMGKKISLRYKIFFNPNARLIHNESTIAREKVAEVSAMFVRNYSYLFFTYFYTQNRLRIIAYWWSIFGLLLEAILTKNKQKFSGYYREVVHKNIN